MVWQFLTGKQDLFSGNVTENEKFPWTPKISPISLIFLKFLLFSKKNSPIFPNKSRFLTIFMQIFKFFLEFPWVFTILSKFSMNFQDFPIFSRFCPSFPGFYQFFAIFPIFFNFIKNFPPFLFRFSRILLNFPRFF